MITPRNPHAQLEQDRARLRARPEPPVDWHLSRKLRALAQDLRDGRPWRSWDALNAAAITGIESAARAIEAPATPAYWHGAEVVTGGDLQDVLVSIGQLAESAIRIDGPNYPLYLRCDVTEAAAVPVLPEQLTLYPWGRPSPEIEVTARAWYVLPVGDRTYAEIEIDLA